MSIYERIEMLRHRRGISQGKMEKELGLSNGLVSKWKTNIPKADKLKLVADYFEVPLEYLMTGEMPKETGLTGKEMELLMLFRELNDYGKDALLETLDDMTQLPKYTQKNVSRSDEVI